MTKTEKVTKKQKFTKMMEVLAAVDATILDPEAQKMLIEFCEAELAALDRRADAARRAAAKKREQGDELMDRVQETLNADEFRPIAAILADLDDEEITAQKVIARLRKLEKAEVVVKEQITIENEKGKRKVQGYKLA